MSININVNSELKLNIDLELKFLGGRPVKLFDSNNVNICTIYPTKLRDIIDMGYIKYNQYYFHMKADIDDIGLGDIDKSKYTYWDIMVSNLYYDEPNEFGIYEYTEDIYSAFKLFLHCKNIKFDKNQYCFFVDDKIISKEIFDSIQKIIRWQNCEKKDSENECEEKFSSKLAEEIYKKQQAGRKALEKKLNKESDADSKLTLLDLMSVVAANVNGLNIFRVKYLTMYQLNDQLNRMQMIEEYNVNIQQLLAGATAENVKLKHYIRPIES